MNLNEAKDRIHRYLKSNHPWSLIVDVQTKDDLSNIINHFNVGDNRFPSINTFCSEGGILKLDEIYTAISHNKGDTFFTGITGFLKLLGEKETKNALKIIATTNISGHVVVFTYQCKNYLKFSDPRFVESGRLLFVDGEPDKVTEICFISSLLADVFPGSYKGLQYIGHIIESCSKSSAYIVTTADKNDFPESVYHITQIDNAYKILIEKDPRTSSVPQSFGTQEQWNYVLKNIGSSGDWNSIFIENFGSDSNLSNKISEYSEFNEQKKWLYFIALSICGVKDNEYLQLAVNNAQDANKFVSSLFCAILSIDREDLKFAKLYEQRKGILGNFKHALPEVTDYCKVLSIKGENAIYYLTDLTQPEKERVIAWLAVYGAKYSQQELHTILATVYPDLAYYLSDFRYKDKLLDRYFKEYKYQKVINKILPSFEDVVDEQSKRMDFVTVLKPRTSVVEKLDVTDAKAFFFDALGVEYLAFIQEKCNKYGLSANISCARCELPSITEFNKEFVGTLKSKGCSVSDIKELDEIKHHGEDNFDYEKEKTPIYLIRELEIIDELLVKIRAGVFGGLYKKAIIISDHGASRLAVLHDTENIWSMATTGEHSGRCCRVSEIDSKPEFAIEASGFWVLSNYDRFKGSRKANVEVHGGASLEEVAIPIIEITKKQSNVDAFITDDSKIITLGAKEHAVIRIYVNIKSNNISIRLDNMYFDATVSADPYVYSVDLAEYTKKGTYTFDILNGNDVIATAQQFEIRKKGMSEVKLFD